LSIIKNERLVKIKAVDWGWREDTYEIKEGLFQLRIIESEK